MKVNRIDIIIKRADNIHKPYLSNDCLELMRRYRFGGEYRNEEIKFSSMPESVLKVLDELKVVYQRITKGGS